MAEWLKIKCILLLTNLKVELFFSFLIEIVSQYCGNCSELYNTTPLPGQVDRFPEIFCDGYHAFCKLCCSQLKLCSICQRPKVNTRINYPIEDLEHNQKAITAEIPILNYEEIEKEQFEPVAFGSSSDVYSCKWKGNQVALKRMRFKEKSDQPDLIRHEAMIGFHLRHPNIIQMFGLTQLANNHLGIILEWADQGSLNDHMTSLTESQKIRICICISNGIKYLHSSRIAHRDLKPHNVLLFGNKTLAKISDFGTSKAAQTILAAASSIVGTPKYSAPEMMQRGKYCFRAVGSHCSLEGRMLTLQHVDTFKETYR